MKLIQEPGRCCRAGNASSGPGGKPIPDWNLLCGIWLVLRTDIRGQLEAPPDHRGARQRRSSADRPVATPAELRQLESRERPVPLADFMLRSAGSP